MRLELAPVKDRTIVSRRSFSTPTGSYYMVGVPDIELARELVDLGMRRVVFTAALPTEEWPEVETLFLNAGVEIAPTWDKGS